MKLCRHMTCPHYFTCSMSSVVEWRIRKPSSTAWFQFQAADTSTLSSLAHFCSVMETCPVENINLFFVASNIIVVIDQEERNLDATPLSIFPTEHYFMYTIKEPAETTTMWRHSWSSRHSNEDFHLCLNYKSSHRVDRELIPSNLRVADMRSRIRNKHAGPFQLLSSLSGFPFIVDEHALVRDLLPSGSTVFIETQFDPIFGAMTYCSCRRYLSQTIQRVENGSRLENRNCNGATGAVQPQSRVSDHPLAPDAGNIEGNHVLENNEIAVPTEHSIDEPAATMPRLSERNQETQANSGDGAPDSASVNLRQRSTTRDNTTTAMVVDLSFVEDSCSNCRRTQFFDTLREDDCLPYPLRLVRVELDHLCRRQKFNHIDKTLYETDDASPAIVPLCAECYSYFVLPYDRAGDPHSFAHVWPAFVWSLLQVEDVGMEAWRLLPTPWKLWWKRAVALKHQLSVAQLMLEPSFFSEVTVPLKKDSQALTSLRWAQDILPRELSLTLPSVKCPAGCAEFKHKSNNLPLDVVWLHFLQVDVSAFTQPSSFGCWRWFRDDYLQPDLLFWNPRWQCRPSIAFDKESMAPMVLCCRHHKLSDKQTVIHPCRHPLGTISTEKSSQFTPVTAVPRTLRKAQYSKYSLSFRIAKMEGCYRGIDTMFLAADGGHHHYQSVLAWDFERTAIKNRPDLKAHIGRLANRRKISHGLVENLLRPIPGHLSHHKHSKGGSFMTQDDATKLQHNLFFGRNETCRIAPTEDKPSHILTYRAKYPRHLIHVHPVGCTHGELPYQLPTFSLRGGAKFDVRAAWILSGMLLCVPELWHSVAVSRKNPDTWEGWLLTYLTAKALPHLSLPGHKSPYKVLSEHDLCRDRLHISDSYEPNDIHRKFDETYRQLRSYAHILRAWNNVPKDIPADKTILIVVNKVTRPREGRALPKVLRTLLDGWEFRFVALTNKSPDSTKPDQFNGSVYFRYGGAHHSSYWRLRQGSTRPMKMSKNWGFSELKFHATKWNVCVFVRKLPFVGIRVRNQILEACGGQHRMQCEVCEAPLIITPALPRNVCCASLHMPTQATGICRNSCRYACPNDSCATAVCLTHYNYLCQVGTQALQPIDESVRSAIVERRSKRRRLAASATAVENHRPSNDSTPEEFHHDAFHLGTRQGLDDFMDAPLLLDADETEEQHFSPNGPAVEVPTTDTSAEPVFSSVTTPTLHTTRITNHALLNCYGSCLVRRNKRLAGTLSQQSFLQRLVATSGTDAIPLVYPEAMLFSDIFYASSADGSMYGALPAALLHGDDILRQNGMASLQTVYRTRLLSPGLLTSTNPKYHLWAFDALANFSLRGHDSRLILRRGFAEKQDGGGVRMKGVSEPIFDSDHVECRSLVNKISATCSWRMPTYFYTHTCNMKTHFGMRLLWDWITGDDICRLHCREVTAAEIDHWRRSVIESAGVMLLHVWMELVQIWLHYISKSPDMPAGKVLQFLARLELQQAWDKFQDVISKGNLPHVHCLLHTDDDVTTIDGLKKACDRIRGRTDDLIREDEAESYLSSGVFQSITEIDDFRDTMRSFLDHKHHRRCFVLKQSEVDGQYRLHKMCKVAENWKLTDGSGEHRFRNIPVSHSQEAIRVMMDIGMAERCEAEGPYGFRFIPAVDFLKSEKHIPPCKASDGIMSPVIGALVAINPNSDNCQLSNGYFVARYLAKYVIKIDQYLTINLRPPHPIKTSTPDHFEVSGEQLHNTKITSNAVAQAEKTNSGHNPKSKNALGLNVTDIYLKMLGHATILTNFRHVRYCTDTYDSRAARCRKEKPVDFFRRTDDVLRSLQNSALSAMNTVPAHHAREASQSTLAWRRFRPSQVTKAFDDLYSPLTMDPVTKFGMRPPELHFVMHQRMYHRWFTTHTPTYRITVRANNINVTETRQAKTLAQLMRACLQNYTPDYPLDRTQWISAASRVIKVRAAAIDEVLHYLHEVPLEVFNSDQSLATSVRLRLFELFRTIKGSIDWVLHGVRPPREPRWNTEIESRYANVFQRFVSEKDHTILPVPWTTPVRPTQPVKFLIHLLLGHGAFIDEYSLFQSGSLRQAFIHAKLLDPSHPDLSATALVRKYFAFELKCLPVGTPTFDRYCVAANNIVQHFFRNNAFYSNEVPCVLYCRLKQQTTDEIEAFFLQRKRQVVTTLLRKLRDAGFIDLPSEDDFLLASRVSPLNWDISNLARPAGQPVDSHREQSALLQVAKDRIDSYISSTGTSSPLSLCYVGAGGVGKTTSAMITLLYARAQGLTVNATALVSERAQELGVPHLNNDFAIPRVDLNAITPGQLAERVISSLYRKPCHLEFHRTVEVEFIDEMGPISSEIWTARDIVLRYIRNSTRVNGGKLDVLTFDHLQTHPVQGTHPLMNPFLCSTHSFHRLKETVRTQHAGWKRLQEISRMCHDDLTQEGIKDEFIRLLTQHCNFVSSNSLAPAGALYVYGKNAPVRHLLAQHHRLIQTRPNVLTSTSVDYECTFEGRYTLASDAVSRTISTKIREPRLLHFYKGARYRITHNKPGKYSNGQLAFLHRLPERDAVKHKRPLEFLLAPPGSTYIPCETDTELTLAAMGWTKVMIGVSPDNTVHLGHLRAKRTSQYGLQPYVGSTFHSTMGKTLALLVTQIGIAHSRSDIYALWDPSQVVILLSRTRLPSHTTFVTDDPRQTAERLFKVLLVKSPFRDHLSRLVDSLCGFNADQRPVMRDHSSIFRPRDVLLPPDNGGFAYLLVSTVDTTCAYIGSCYNLIKRYERHNRGLGARQTALESMRPWAMYAYVCGFAGDRTRFLGFETEWILAKVRAGSVANSPNYLVNLAEGLVQDFNSRYNICLKLVVCGELADTPTSDTTMVVHSSSDSEASATDREQDRVDSDDSALPSHISLQSSGPSSDSTNCTSESYSSADSSVADDAQYAEAGDDSSDASEGRDDHEIISLSSDDDSASSTTTGGIDW